ncbi:MAG TPA: hypothetical protein GX707_18750 [Epulopiscium sp.]|nr:hypothetical protein [Candidatus Epulonipiscium sp.]
MTIDKLEVLRYLGHTNQDIDSNTEQLLNECLIEINELMTKKFVYELFDMDKKENSISLRDTILVMESKDISNHLAKSDKCVLMAASLGLQVDIKIAYYSRTDVTKSLILDAYASTAIEALCDEIEETIRKEACDHGYNITSRFSPGYGDLPITLQKPITQVLKTYPKMGLTVNESSIMLPRKSVTAIIGWQKEQPDTKIIKCKLCNKQNCSFRRAEYNG